MKTKVFIDLDGTVLDANKIKQPLIKYLQKSGFDLKTLNHVYKQLCLELNYTNTNYILKLNKQNKFDIQSAIDYADHLVNNSEKYVFSGANTVLEKLNKNKKIELILLSLGNKDFQESKARCSGLIRYFKQVHFCSIEKYQYLKNIVDNNEMFYIVDDRGDALEKVKIHFPNAIPIEINRSEISDDPAEKNVNFDHKIIRSLSELIEILK